METVFFGKNKKTAVLKPFKCKSLIDFYNFCIKTPRIGVKGGYYFTTASEIEITLKQLGNSRDGRDTDHYRRNSTTHLSSWCVCIDGDRSI